MGVRDTFAEQQQCEPLGDGKGTAILLMMAGMIASMREGLLATSSLDVVNGCTSLGWASFIGC